jgi:hypothetical protein
MKALDRENAQLIRRQKVAEKAAQKRQGQGRWRRNEELPLVAEDEWHPAGGAAACAAARSSTIFTPDRTLHVDWASASKLQRTCATSGAFSQYSVSNSPLQEHPFVHNYGLLSGMPMPYPQFLPPFEGPLLQTATPIPPRQ